MMGKGGGEAGRLRVGRSRYRGGGVDVVQAGRDVRAETWATFSSRVRL